MADRYWEQLRSTPDGVEATDREVADGLDELEASARSARNRGRMILADLTYKQLEQAREGLAAVEAGLHTVTQGVETDIIEPEDFPLWFELGEGIADIDAEIVERSQAEL